jgi:hypothetical protein
LAQTLLLKLGLCCVLILGEIYLAIIFLDQGLVAWSLYENPLIPGGDHFKLQHLVYGLLFNGFLLHGVWRSMD